MDKEKKKKEVINWIRKLNGRLSTTRLMALLSLNLYATRNLLEEMYEVDKILIKEEETNATYWRENK